MTTMLTEDILKMLFDELGEEAGQTYNEWVEDVGYSSSWNDQTIYNALPPVIQAAAGDIVMNTSWYHGGM